jgi:hypothetical protein
LGKNEKSGKHGPGDSIKEETKTKKGIKNQPSNLPENSETWFKRLLYDILYYRSKETYCSSKKIYTKVKLPRSRHK